MLGFLGVRFFEWVFVKGMVGCVRGLGGDVVYQLRGIPYRCRFKTFIYVPYVNHVDGSVLKLREDVSSPTLLSQRSVLEKTMAGKGACE